MLPVGPSSVVGAVMWTAAQVATRDKISKQAVTRRVRDYALNHGLRVERNHKGSILAFNVVEYDHLRGRYGDPSKAQAPKVEPPEIIAVAANETYDEARRQQACLDAERSRLALDEAKGLLVPVDDVRDAIATAGGIIAGIFDRLPNAADDLAPTIAREGSHGLRLGLSDMAVRMRKEIATALQGAVSALSTNAKEVAPTEPVAS